MVSDVLSAMEYSEGQTIQELSLCQETSHWLESPSSLLLQEFWYAVQLRDFILVESYMLLELIYSPVKFFASIGLEKFQ